MNNQSKTNPKASAPCSAKATQGKPETRKLNRAQCFSQIYGTANPAKLRAKQEQQPQHSPSPQRWQAQIDDLCTQRNDYKRHADKLAEALHLLLCDSRNHDKATQALAEYQNEKGGDSNE